MLRRRFLDTLKYILLAASLSWAGASAETIVRLGVLAFQGKAAAEKRWSPTAAYLSQSMRGTSVRVLPLTYDEINQAVQNQTVDAVLTNPEHFVALQKAFGLRPLSTLASSINGQAHETFGGVIFTLASSKIKVLDDVRDQRVSAVGLYSLGGFLSQALVFTDAGIDIRSKAVRSLRFTDVPHDRVVQDVLEGHADVGLVRAGVLERMATQGLLNLDDIRVLHPADTSGFPYRLSTALYPEWPFAVMPHMSGLLARDLVVALQSIQPGTEPALAGQYHAFVPVADYTPVAQLMRRLKVTPKVDNESLWTDLWNEYESTIKTIASAMTLVLMGLLAYVHRQYRYHQRLTRLYQTAQHDLKISATAFNSQVGLIVTDGQTRILKANQAFCDLMGYAESDILHQSTKLFRCLKTPPGTLRTIWPLLQSVGYWEGELLCRHRDGDPLPCMVTMRAVNEADGHQGFVASFSDLSTLKASERAIRDIAYFDSLTGLPNRRMFLENLNEVIHTCAAQHTRAALMFIDLDHFKILNDTHGHLCGDQYLRQLSERIADAIPSQATVSRLGGDEFVVMLTELPADEQAAIQQSRDTAAAVHRAMLTPCTLTSGDGNDGTGALVYHCSGSIGITLFGDRGETASDILKRADMAMYQAKQAGRNTIRVFDESTQQSLLRKGALLANLSQAVTQDQFVLHYQLQTDVLKRAIGAEALVRWQHPVQGLVSPAEFIALAEESGAIIAIGDWVVWTACQTLAKWAQTPGLQNLTLSINVSPRQFSEDNFVDKLQHALSDSGARPEKLILEITEGIVIQNTEAVIRKMHDVRALGLGFSVDDFGTGYSSLSYLQKLPLKQVKIDKSFVMDVTYNPHSEAIVRSILALSHTLNLSVVSEGVETVEQHRMLAKMGCDYFQGYLLGRPAELSAFELALPSPETQAEPA